jgi:hypothetical protein
VQFVQLSFRKLSINSQVSLRSHSGTDFIVIKVKDNSHFKKAIRIGRGTYEKYQVVKILVGFIDGYCFCTIV